MVFLGLRLDKKLKLELENNFDYDLIICDTVVEYLEKLKLKRYDAIIIEEKSYREDTLINLIIKTVAHQKRAVVLVLGETSNLEIVAGSLKAGAYDYILKPISAYEIGKKIQKSINDKKTLSEKIEKRQNVGSKLVGRSKEMIEVYKKIGTVSKSLLPVLITGERGTGKTSVAAAVHQFSSNNNEPFLSLNCLALGSELTERKLFGYEKGAFTGAIITQIGDLEKVSAGTIHLANIENLSMELQSKLLYVIEEGEFYRIGSPTPIRSKLRIIASTNKNLTEMILNGTFLEELYLKLQILEIHIPSLRERKEDIPVILDHYIKQCNVELDADVKGISKTALKKILRYDWPGNVNELKNAIKSAVAIAKGSSILLEDLPSTIVGLPHLPTINNRNLEYTLKEWVNAELIELTKTSGVSYYESIVFQVEKELIKQVLELTNGKKSDASEALGITRNTLRAKMQLFELE